MALILSAVGLSSSFADVKSTTGLIHMDSNNDGVSEAILNATGLSVGSSTATANLSVSGNALIIGALSVGGNTVTSSNLNLHGTMGMSVFSVNVHTYMGNHSMYLVDTSTTNLILQLPVAETSQGRQITIKKTSKSGNLDIVGGLVETASSYQIVGGGNYMPSLTLVNSANTWNIMSSYGVESAVTTKKVFHAKFDEDNGSSSPVASVNGFVGTYKNMASANIGVTGNIGLACDFEAIYPVVMVTM